MRNPVVAFTLTALLASTALGPAFAQDPGGQTHDGVTAPLLPKNAAGAWTLESQGHSICRVVLHARPSGPDRYGIDIPADCAGALPPGVSAWRPVTDGLALIDDEGRIVIDFDSWSPELLVSRRISHNDLQLRRAAY